MRRLWRDWRHLLRSNDPWDQGGALLAVGAVVVVLSALARAL